MLIRLLLISLSFPAISPFLLWFIWCYFCRLVVYQSKSSLENTLVAFHGRPISQSWTAGEQQQLIIQAFLKGYLDFVSTKKMILSKNVSKYHLTIFSKLCLMCRITVFIKLSPNTCKLNTASCLLVHSKCLHMTECETACSKTLDLLLFVVSHCWLWNLLLFHCIQ